MTAESLFARCRDWLRLRGHAVDRLEALAGDVSARRYFRLHDDGESSILAVYPDELRASCARWIVTDRLLRGAGVRAPEILDADCEAGFMLLEDLGPETLRDRSASPWPALRPWLDSAVEIADRIRAIDAAEVADLQPPLGEKVLTAELEQTRALYLEPRGLCGEEDLAAALRAGLRRLVATLAAARPEPCHRDFMARNLVPLADGGLAVLDHQDLRLGPPFYDLASLTNDTFYLSATATAELLGERLGGAEARLAFHRAAAQRTLKIVGTFEAFRRRGDARHAPLIRPSLEAALAHLGELPETADLADRLRPVWTRPPAALLD